MSEGQEPPTPHDLQRAELGRLVGIYCDQISKTAATRSVAECLDIIRTHVKAREVILAHTVLNDYDRGYFSGLVYAMRVLEGELAARVAAQGAANDVG